MCGCVGPPVQVVLRGGLVAPWMAVPPLVAQLTDELPETRATALKVCVTSGLHSNTAHAVPISSTCMQWQGQGCRPGHLSMPS
jgi:hypothetical protein